MGENSQIEWTDHTFNPWWGCQEVHEGCRHCYAREWAKRFGVKWGPQGVRRVASEAQWKEPLKWNRAAEKAGVRAKVFCASMADVFEDWPGQVSHSTGIPMWIEREQYRMDNHPFGWGAGVVCDEPHKYSPLTLDNVRVRLFRLIDETPWLDWQLLTKRPENIRRMWREWSGDYESLNSRKRWNVQLGTSISDQASADKQVRQLRKCRGLSPVSFLSIEPLLGPIALDLSGIDWVIVGGESGHGARPMHPDWARSLRDQCKAASVPFLFKQWGEWRPVRSAIAGFPEPVCGGRVKWGTLNRSGDWFPATTPWNGRQDAESADGECVMVEVGKKASGRMLDFRVWNEFPTNQQETANHAATDHR